VQWKSNKIEGERFRFQAGTFKIKGGRSAQSTESKESQLSPSHPFFQKIDCVRLYVSDLDEALAFYRDRLGHELAWRSDRAAGLRMPDTDAEIVLQTEERGQEIDLKVEAADEAAARFVEAGGVLLVPPFDIQIGRCAVVADPWGNPLVLLDTSKGLLLTDETGNIIGNQVQS
jgi:lactoylglutathione lyase